MHSTDLATVIEQERSAIAQRRTRVGILSKAEVTVGLALSGGGIRSGSFCLGFLQSLYRNGVLRHIDYLSTVSGGGYAGAFLSSLVHSTQSGFIEWSPAKSPNDNLDLAPQADPRRPSAITPIVFGGQNLRDPVGFTRRWLFGVLFLNLFALSGLVAIASLGALLFRAIDSPGMAVYVAELGFPSDLGHALFWPSLALLSWLMTTVLGYRYPRIKILRRPSFLAFVCFFAMGCVALLTTADVSVPVVEDRIGATPPSELRHKISEWQGTLEKLMLGALVAALLPYLNPKEVLRSGAKPRSVIEDWIFAIASRAFLVGIPLVVFSFLVRENVSGHNARRDDMYSFRRVHFSPLPDFLKRLQWEHEGCSKPGSALWEWITSQTNCKRDNGLPDLIERSHEMRARDVSFRKTLGCLSPLAWPTFMDRVKRRDQLWKDEDVVAASLSGCLLANGLVMPASETSANRVQVDVWDGATVTTTVDRCGDKIEYATLAALHKAYGRLHNDRELAQEIQRLEWQQLERHYGGHVRDPNTVFAWIVTDHDQRRRFEICLVSTLLFVATGFLINLNRISIHGFYRYKLGQLWIAPYDDVHGPGLKDMNTHTKGAPYHIINGAANLMERSGQQMRRPTAPFILSHLFCGSTPLSYCTTRKYADGNVTLADAMAIAGGAVTPSAVANPLARVLMLLLNMRLGRWLPNPKIRRVTRLGWAAPLRVFVNWLIWSPEERAMCFVSDGGHDENTGIYTLLERKCRIIVAVDATWDPNYEFRDLLRMMRLARAELGVRFVDPQHGNHLPLTNLVPERRNRRLVSESCYVVIEIQYAQQSDSDQQKVYMILVKPTLTGAEPSEVALYTKENAELPHDATIDQFYDVRRCECYRQLGEVCGDKLCKGQFAEHRDRHPNTIADAWMPSALTSAKGA